MLNRMTPSWIVVGWSAAVALAAAWSVGADARLSTSALLLLAGTAPGLVLLRLRPRAAAVARRACAPSDGRC